MLATAAATALATRSAAYGAQLDGLLAPAAACPGSADARGSNTSKLAAMACLIAYARARAGAPAVLEMSTLDRAASMKLAAEIRCGALTHTPCLKPFYSFFGVAGYSLATPVTVGENLALGQGVRGAPRQVMEAWLGSPVHRANVVSPTWKSFGLAVSDARSFLRARGARIWVCEFGSR